MTPPPEKYVAEARDVTLCSPPMCLDGSLCSLHAAIARGLMVAENRGRQMRPATAKRGA
jgi:hypothetical protein